LSLQIALQLLSQGNFAAAEPAAAAALKQAPFNPVCHAVHGAALLELGDLTIAEERFKSALDLGLAEPQKAWFNLGKIYVESNRDLGAIDAFGKALEIDPNYLAALIDMTNPLCREGLTQADMGLINQAQANCRKIKKLAPKTPGLEVLQLRTAKAKAVLLLDAGREKDAIQAVKQPLKKTTGQQPRLVVRRSADLKGQTLTSCQVLSGEKEWYLVTENEAYLAEMANANPEVSDYVAALGKDKVVLSLPRKASKVDSAFLLGGSTNYYHWLLDYFPRLRQFENHRDLPLLINENPTAFQLRCLELAGISQDQLLPVPMPGRIEVENLIAPPVATRNQIPDPETLPWLRESFGVVAAKTPKRRLYVSRADASLRRVVNENEVISLLEPLGFEVITPGEMDVTEQAKTFSEAAIIISPHGAALTNLAFAPNGCSVIELMGGLRLRQGFFESLAKAGDQDFKQLRCAPQGTVKQRQTVNEQDFDMLVPMPALKEALKGLGIS